MKTQDSTGSEICGATNRNGEPCQLSAGWGTPGSGGGRCKFHGGLSTGPTDTSHLDGNDYAEGNPGGGAPEGNENAKIHGGFGDWRQVWDRADEETLEYMEWLLSDVRETARWHARDVPKDRRDRLLREYVARKVMLSKLQLETWPNGPGRGFMMEEEIERDGVTYTQKRPNPALDAEVKHRVRCRNIREELRLLPGLQDPLVQQQREYCEKHGLDGPE